MDEFNGSNVAKEIAIPEELGLKPGDKFWDGREFAGVVTELHLKRGAISTFLIVRFERFDNKVIDTSIMRKSNQEFDALYNKE